MFLLKEIRVNDWNYSLLDLIVNEINCTMEQESTSSGAREPSRDELISVGQHSVAVGAREEASSADVLEKNSAHDLSLLYFFLSLYGLF